MKKFRLFLTLSFIALCIFVPKFLKLNAFLYLRSCPKQFDIVFSDAPYDLEGLEEIVPLVLDGDILREDGIFIFEHSDKFDFSNHPYFWQLRSYGSVQFSMFRKQ